WPQQTVGHLDGSVKPGDTGEQNLAGIGAADSSGLLVPVERQRVRAQLRTPEARVESLGELIGFSLEEPRALGPAEPFGAARQNLLGAVHVPLHLRYRDWALSKAPVGMKKSRPLNPSSLDWRAPARLRGNIRESRRHRGRRDRRSRRAPLRWP